MASVHTMDYGSMTVAGLGSSNRRKERWSPLFWGLLKVVGLFHHKYLVTERKCFSCEVKHICQRSAGLTRKLHHSSRKKFQVVDSLMLSYECDAKDKYVCKKRSLLEGDDDDEEADCQVCMTLWWNSSGQPCMFTDGEIGVSGWNHRGSRVFSLLLLLLLLALSVYNVTYAFLKLWNHPGRTTELLTEIIFFLFIASNSLAVLCCKLRCIFKEELPLFEWASMLNARYIIKRAQLLDLHSSGLPGRLFLLLCICWPLINSCLRCVMFLTFTKPEDGDAYTRAVITSIIGLLMMETWGIFTYIVYIVRISFQRQFSLLLSFIKEHEGQIDVCRGVLSDVVTDFSCFRRFSKFYTLSMFPVAFLAMVSLLSWEYLTYQACGGNEEVVIVQTLIAVYGWSEIAMGISLYIPAQGGVDVIYLWNNFFRDVIKLHSDRHDIFWRKLIRCMSIVSKNETNLFLVSVIFSALGVYMALNIQNQHTSYLAKGCIISNETNYS